MSFRTKKMEERKDIYRKIFNLECIYNQSKRVIQWKKNRVKHHILPLKIIRPSKNLLTKPPSKLWTILNYIIRTHAHYLFGLYNLKRVQSVEKLVLWGGEGVMLFKLYNLNHLNIGFFGGQHCIDNFCVIMEVRIIWNRLLSSLTTIFTMQILKWNHTSLCTNESVRLNCVGTKMSRVRL
jgi:hypothetical protein